MHNNIQPRTVLLNKSSRTLSLVDWGRADFYAIGRVHDPFSTDISYRSPEQLIGVPEFHYSSDMWSVGCIFAELVAEIANRG